MRMYRCTLPAVLLAGVVLLFGVTAHAHEFWIEPSSYVALGCDHLTVAVRVGEHFTGQPVPRKNDRIERFAVTLPGASPVELGFIPITGAEGDEPAGRIDSAIPALMILVYDSNHSSITLDAESFEGYLKEKGLDAVRTAREKAGTQAEPGREIYSRCAKSLVSVVGDNGVPLNTKYRDRPVGLQLEIVADFEPLSRDVSQSMPFRVLFNSKPLAGALVTAVSKQSLDSPQHARTDAEGRVQFRATDSGPWLVDCTHMVTLDKAAAAKTVMPDAEYESFWASLTFETRK